MRLVWGAGAVRWWSAAERSLLSEFLADLWQHVGAEQLDGLEVGGVRHAADVHLEDLAGVAEHAVEVQDPVGDLVGAAGEHHAAGLELRFPAGWCHRRAADFG